MDQHFKVIIPVYNSEKWIKGCIESLISQTYTNWEAIVIDDDSKDKTLKNIPSHKQIQLIKNYKNCGALSNIVLGIETLCGDENVNHDEDIIVLLDGDDKLYDKDALEFVNAIYQEKDVWLTYGNFVNSREALGGNDLLNSDTPVREQSWKTSHLRTFKYKIWKQIANKDLRDRNGDYYKMAWDLAIMYPLIEMSGLDRIRFINKKLYSYNDVNPLNDCRQNVHLQLCLDKEIRAKKAYRRI